MKITKTASGKTEVRISKQEWINIGKKAGWVEDNWSIQNVMDNYTHYQPVGQGPSSLNAIGMFELFNVEQCENCGGDVALPNSIKIKAPLALIKDSQLQPSQNYYPEVYPCDECGGNYCENCECTHGQSPQSGEQTGHIIEQPKYDDQKINMATVALSQVDNLKNKLNEPGIFNGDLMANMFALITGLNMIGRSTGIDQEFQSRIMNNIKVLSPIAKTIKNNFMATPSKQSVAKMHKALGEIEKLLKQFIS